MSKIDYQALREAAEKATPGNWWIDSHGQAMVSFVGNDVLEVFTTDNKRAAVRHEDTGNLSRWRNDNDATFIATADPATVLALLDELEEAEKRIDTLRQDKDKVIDMSIERVNKLLSRAESAEKRIAELEALTAPQRAVPDALERLRSIVADPKALPRRKEWISGQQYSYVLLENVEAMVDESCRAAMLQGAEPETDNTNQQFESLSRGDK